jgi:hypothetical protein
VWVKIGLPLGLIYKAIKLLNPQRHILYKYEIKVKKLQVVQFNKQVFKVVINTKLFYSPRYCCLLHHYHHYQTPPPPTTITVTMTITKAVATVNTNSA